MDAFTAVIADDHAIVRHALRDVVAAAGGRVVDEAADGLEAVAKAKQHRPALMLLDLAMPLADGGAVFLEVRRWSPQTRFIVFTGQTSRQQLSRLIADGVHGLFMKASDPAKIAQALPTILRGGQVIADEVRAMVGDQAPTTLTAREAQVLALIAKGHTNKAIAEALGVSFKTVDHHRTNLMRKLCVSSTAALLATALREGFLDGAAES
ncbi:MAG: response regulator transcription factor [Pseudomonadota bacterium]